MDSESSLPSVESVKCRSCGSYCSLTSSYPAYWIRSVKRKFDEFEDGNRFFIPGFSLPIARVQIENECAALREALSSQQKSIQDLYVELDEERNASSTAANEAMSMILRLQREKAEIQMEARQFKRFAEEKMGHDQQELAVLEDLLYKREQAIQSLTCEVQAYKHRMMSFGLTESEAEGEKNQSMLEEGQFDFPMYDYPPLRCDLNEVQGALEIDKDVADVEKYAFRETPEAHEQLKNLEFRISQMERTPKKNQVDNILEKVIVGQSPRRARHSRRFSTDSSGSFFGLTKETCHEFTTESPRLGAKKFDNVSDIGDDTSDRVYTIDAVHSRVPYNGVTETKVGIGSYDDYMTTPRETVVHADFEDPEIKKLYMRLQAIEADRESMRQTIISMQTDKAQLLLLKEVAQQLCKDMSPECRMPVRKASPTISFSFIAVFKWIVSVIFWRNKTRRSKYMFGLSANNVGLLMLLDKGPRVKPWRCLLSTHV